MNGPQLIRAARVLLLLVTGVMLLMLAVPPESPADWGKRERIGRGNLAPPQVVLTGKGAEITAMRFARGRGKCCSDRNDRKRGVRFSKTTRKSTGWPSLKPKGPWFAYPESKKTAYLAAGVGRNFAYRLPEDSSNLIRVRIGGKERKLRWQPGSEVGEASNLSIARSRDGRVSMMAWSERRGKLKVAIAGRPAVRKRGAVKTMTLNLGRILSSESRLWGAVAADGRVGLAWAREEYGDSDVEIWSIWRDRSGRWSKPEVVSMVEKQEKYWNFATDGIAIGFDESPVRSSDPSAYVAWRDSGMIDDQRAPRKWNEYDDRTWIRGRTSGGEWNERQLLTDPEPKDAPWHDPLDDNPWSDQHWLGQNIRIDVDRGRFAVAWAQIRQTVTGSSRQLMVASGRAGNVESVEDLGRPAGDLMEPRRTYLVPVLMPGNRIMALAYGVTRYRGIAVRELSSGKPKRTWRTIGGRQFKQPKWDPRFGYAVRKGRLAVAWGDPVETSRSSIFFREFS